MLEKGEFIFKLLSEDEQKIKNIVSNYTKVIENELEKIEKEYIPIQKIKEKIVKVKKLLKQKPARGDGKSTIKLINYTKAIGKLEVLEELLEESNMCEYCKEDMQSKSIEEQAIETLVDGTFLYNWCDCGRHTVQKINYCPMCGKKLNNEEGKKYETKI